MKVLFEEDELSCISLETAVGLGRGDIKAITIYPEGTVEIDTNKTLTVDMQTKIRGELVKRGLVRGKKLAT